MIISKKKVMNILNSKYKNMHVPYLNILHVLRTNIFQMHTCTI